MTTNKPTASTILHPEGSATTHAQRGVALELGFTVALVALLLVSALKFLPAVTHSNKTMGALLVGVLLPIGTMLLLAVVERCFPPAGPRKSLKIWLINFQLNIAWILLAGLVGTVMLIGTNKLAGSLGVELGFIRLSYDKATGILGLIAAAWISTVVGDFFFYWYHRAVHKSNFLWQSHKIHHMDRQLDAITLLRANWTDVLISTPLMTLPHAILFKTENLSAWELGLTSGTIATMFILFLQAGHANVRLQAGWASVLWCTPQVHRIHHSCLPEHRDKNFAFSFPLWDVLFGTYYAPKRGEFPPTGVEGEKDIESFWQAQALTPIEWWKLIRARFADLTTPYGRSRQQ